MCEELLCDEVMCILEGEIYLVVLGKMVGTGESFVTDVAAIRLDPGV